MDRTRLLGVYLDDHLVLVGATAALSKRMLGNADGPLVDLLGEVRGWMGEDRLELRALMAEHGLSRSRVKPVLGMLAERAGRLKLNGALVRRSPLTPLVEMEGLRLLLTGVAARWAALEAAGVAEQSEPSRRAERAAGAAGRLEELRLAAAPGALGAPGARGAAAARSG